MRKVLHHALKIYLRHSPIRKGKERLLSLFWQPLSSKCYQRRARLKGTQIELDCDLTQWVQRHLYFLGEYEPESTRYWSRLAREASVIFDVGANVGIYSLLAADANPRATVHSFEPTPELSARFRTAITQNSMSNIVANEAAAGAFTGEAYLKRCRGSDGANEGMNFVSATSSAGAETAAVTQVTLDDYCRRMGITNVDLLKIDIEGGEYDALRGAERLLSAARIGCIFFELSGWAAERAGHSIDDVPNLLRQYGYQLFTLHRGRLRPLMSDSGPKDSVIARPAERSTLPCMS